MGINDAIVPYSNRLADLSIDEMNLTVRSSNGLKRANIHTLGNLRKVLEVENGLQNIRNIGQKSIKEIKQMFFEECYTRMKPYEKASYWQEVIDTNSTLTT
jgi:DNA-directed RNA polymerase subunit alpha